MIKIVDLSQREIDIYNKLFPGWSDRCQAIPTGRMDDEEWHRKKMEFSRRYKKRKH